MSSSSSSSSSAAGGAGGGALRGMGKGIGDAKRYVSVDSDGSNLQKLKRNKSDKSAHEPLERDRKDDARN
jgi:Sec-independent protein translocase protein TatA